MSNRVLISIAGGSPFRIRRSTRISGTWLQIALPLLVLLVLSLTIPSRSAFAAGGGAGTRIRASSTISDIGETFPMTPVGQTSTLCSLICFCSLLLILTALRVRLSPPPIP